MTPAVTTQTTVIEQFQPNCVEYQLGNRKVSSLKYDTDDGTKTILGNNTKDNDGGQTLDCYDQVLEKKEWAYMSYIRKWEKDVGFLTPIRWNMVFIIVLFHAFTIFYTLYSAFVQGNYPMWQTGMFALFCGQMAGFGVTGGAHRLWCHRSYKAKWPLKVILLICYSVAGQNDLYQWVRDHRVHHKFSENSADPHNANRGFFFSHVGWLMMKKHPDVIREGRKIDMSDIRDDPLVRFHTKYFQVFKAFFCFLLPLMIPLMLWNETWSTAIYATVLRYMLSLNFTWSVNSVAHIWGNKPYDRTIMPVENKVISILAMGEGWHNYHHTFPWDYKAAELPYNHNKTTSLIDMFAKLGWAYDLKVASPSLVHAVGSKRGDPNHFKTHHH